ncbi:MAG TPA: Rieske (2Fe-2S) protein [Blastocatellia bacterium]|nr:Rieske (2Fe-2S) protein [Blastocatellia bacterium]
MADFVKVANTSDLASGQGKVVEVEGRAVALFNCEGEFFAMDNVCAHRGGPLGEGFVDCANRTVQCPWHGWTYELATAMSPVNPLARVEKFDVLVEGEEVKISLE